MVLQHSESVHFNSQPHEEADDFIQSIIEKVGISTHSLTKRLTLKDWKVKWKAAISTHSLTKRLTQFDTEPRMSMSISTHSLTKRLTVLHKMKSMF